MTCPTYRHLHEPTPNPANLNLYPNLPSNRPSVCTRQPCTSYTRATLPLTNHSTNAYSFYAALSDRAQLALQTCPKAPHSHLHTDLSAHLPRLRILGSSYSMIIKGPEGNTGSTYSDPYITLAYLEPSPDRHHVVAG